MRWIYTTLTLRLWATQPKRGYVEYIACVTTLIIVIERNGRQALWSLRVVS